MEENTVELYDYLRVVWKRKIHIIVLILFSVGIGVGVKVMNSKSKLPPVTTYQSKVVIKIGQKLVFSPSAGDRYRSINSGSVAYIDTPVSLVVTLPFKYGFKDRDTLGYNLDVQQIGVTSMLNLTLSGPDIGVERVLREIVNMLIDEHRGKTETSHVAFASFIRKLEADVDMILENIIVAEASIKEIKRRGGAHLENMVAAEAEMKDEKSRGGQTAFMNMLYLKSVDLERDLRDGRKDLRNTEWQLILYQTSMGDIGKYSTEIIGEVASTAIELKKKDTTNVIIVAVIAGLTMAIFMAFFVEYIEESKSRRKRK